MGANMDCLNEKYNEINNVAVECPVCKSKIYYRELVQKENIVLKRYKELVNHLKEGYGEIWIKDKVCLLGLIKELEHIYFVTIKE